MVEANRYKLGLFVIFGLLLICVTLFLIGLRQMFEPKISLITTFDESVQGLESGSPVKFAGVQIGKVTRVTLRPAEKIVLVSVDVNIKAFEENPDSSQFLFYSRQRLHDEVERGLRCQLEFLGITGLKYVEMDYFAKDAGDSEYMAPPEELLPHVFYVPSKRSLMSGIKTSVIDLLAGAQLAVTRFNKLDFDELNAVARESGQMMRSVQNLVQVTEPKMDNLLAAIRETADNISRFVNMLDSQVVSYDLKPKIENVNVAVDGLRSAAMAVVRGRMDFADLNVELREAIRNLNELVKSLDEDPSMLIRGRKKVNPNTGKD